VVDGARSVAVRLRVLTLADKLQVRTHRRQRRTACVRVYVLEDDTVEGAAGVIAKGLECRAAVIPAVVEDRRELARVALVGRTKVLRPAVARVLHRLRHWLDLVSGAFDEELKEDGVELGDQRDVEAVEQ